MSEGQEARDRVGALRAERKRVREDVYALGMRLNAGETALRKDLDAAIARSDEIDAEIRRLTEPPRILEGPRVPAPMYGPPAGRLPRGGGEMPAPMYGPPPGALSFLSRLFRRK